VASAPPPALPPVPDPTVPSAAPPASAAPSSAAPVAEPAVVLTSGQSSAFGRLGSPGLLLFALGTALAGVLMRWYDVLAAGLAGTRTWARSRSTRAKGGDRKR
jgi:hypothetical protein